jgi:hypothetical protein
MKIKTALTSLAVTVLLGLSVHADDSKKAEPKRQTHCPVMERYGIEKSNYVDVKGYRIYTCCKGCINQIKANPDKYIQRLQEQGVSIEKTPTEADESRKETKGKESKNDTQ